MSAIDKHQLGLYSKFTVTRTDGADQPGGKHHGDEYFVLNLTTDLHAITALSAYAKSCKSEYPVLSDELHKIIAAKRHTENEFVTVPEITLPNGTIVPSFRVSRYLASRGENDIPISVSHAVPWVNINFDKAKETCKRAGYNLITETQVLAIAWNISQQDANWSSGKVGEGNLYQGLHKGIVSEAQAGDYQSQDTKEQRWFILSNGERICDVAGNAFTWAYQAALLHTGNTFSPTLI